MTKQDAPATGAPTLEQKALLVLYGEVKQRLDKRGLKNVHPRQILRMIEKKFDQIVAEGKENAAKFLADHAAKKGGQP